MNQIPPAVAARLPRGRVTLGFSYIFLVMASYYILKPVRDSFFLAENPFQYLPRVHLLVLGVTYVTALVYSQALRILGPVRMVTAANGFCLTCIFVFWVVLTQFEGVDGLRTVMAWVYFCWVSVFVVFAVTLTWSMIHTAFSDLQATHSYGLIGAGATCGAMAGGGLTGLLATKVGTANLLLVAACVLGPCLLLGRKLAMLSRDPKAAGHVDAKSDQPFDRTNASQLFLNSPYLCVLGLIVFLWVFIMVLDEYRFSGVIQNSIPAGDETTAFFGSIEFYANMIGLIISIAITGPVLSRWGPRPGMLLFAGLIITVALGFLVVPGLNLVIFAKIAYAGIGYSIAQWSRELLYTQTSTEEKFVAKGFIDTFGFRAGAGIASLALIAAAEIGYGPDGLLTNSVTRLTFITIPLGLTLAVLVWWITHRFQQLRLQRAWQDDDPEAIACHVNDIRSSLT